MLSLRVSTQGMEKGREWIGRKWGDLSILMISFSKNILILGAGTLSVKDKVVNILGFAGYRVYIAITQICSFKTEATINNM